VKSGKLRIAEIGFNAGHSSETLLSNSSQDSTLHSFDICSHPYVSKAKAIIMTAFPGRFELTCGDSATTVPAFIGDKFDVVHVDGHHSYEHAYGDIMNMKKHSHAGTRLIVDDCNPNGGPGDVQKAWNAVVSSGHVRVDHCQGSTNSCAGYFIF
jgi:predicted O-methyltransferase YrrM